MGSEEVMLVVVARRDGTQPVGETNPPAQTARMQKQWGIERQKQDAQGAAPRRAQQSPAGDFEADVGGEDRLVKIDDDGRS